MNHEEDKLYTPIENLQKIEGGGALNRDSLDLDTLPKGIRWIGYVIIGFFVLTILFGIIATLFFE